MEEFYEAKNTLCKKRYHVSKEEFLVIFFIFFSLDTLLIEYSQITKIIVRAIVINYKKRTEKVKYLQEQKYDILKRRNKNHSMKYQPPFVVIKKNYFSYFKQLHI